MRPIGVSVVIATRGRPVLLRRAIRSILAQTVSDPIEIIVVFDHVDIDSLDDTRCSGAQRIVTLSNVHSPGLAGGRNTGIEAASYAFVAFCDDDDEWAPEKLERQLELKAADPDAVVVASGIRIESSGGSYIRLSPPITGLNELLESRITELHPSSFVIDRSVLLGVLGPIDESIPASYGEDYDLLLRAAKLGHIAAVPDPLVIVHWDRHSFFSKEWEAISDGLTYLLDKHPEFESSSKGKARIEGQIAFAHAASNRRREARAWAWRALKRDRTQFRAYVAFAIAAKLLPAGPIVSALNRRGKGL